MSFCSSDACCGSPPRVWGHLGLFHWLCAKCRFTPTRVGTSNLTPPTLSPIAVHPHACGDIVMGRLRRPRRCGSPPRVWGTSRIVSRPLRSPSVHPHACGDILRAGSRFTMRNGSPPRVWGHPAAPASGAPGTRFTPTRVGTSAKAYDEAARKLVHPHACGDITRCPRRFSAFCGSPPRVWGHLLGSGNLFVVGGSPPRVWGHPLMAANIPGGMRFTPTRVGTSLVVYTPPHRPPVHPHACGGHRLTC